MVGNRFGTKVNVPKGRNGRPLRNLRKTTKNVTKRLRSTRPLGTSRGKSVGEVGDQLANFSGIDSARRSKRSKDDPFNQIGL